MPLSKEIQSIIYDYCSNHLASEEWYENEFEFIEDENLKSRLVSEFQGTRFAYKLYEGLEAKGENLIFEIRHQILSYASIYEAVIHYVLYTFYSDTEEFDNLQYHIAPAKIDIPTAKRDTLQKALSHNGEKIIPYHDQRQKKEDSQIKFKDKCLACEKLGLLHKIKDGNGPEIDLVNEIVEIYGYRNAIHLIAEQRKGIEYELELSKLACRRLRPFIDQIKEKLKADKKGIYATPPSN